MAEADAFPFADAGDHVTWKRHHAVDIGGRLLLGTVTLVADSPGELGELRCEESKEDSPGVPQTSKALEAFTMLKNRQHAQLLPSCIVVQLHRPIEESDLARSEAMNPRLRIPELRHCNDRRIMTQRKHH